MAPIQDKATALKEALKLATRPRAGGCCGDDDPVTDTLTTFGAGIMYPPPAHVPTRFAAYPDGLFYAPNLDAVVAIDRAAGVCCAFPLHDAGPVPLDQGGA